MKIQSGVWIDGKLAWVIAFSQGTEMIREISSHIEDKNYQSRYHPGNGSFNYSHPTNNETGYQARKRRQTQQFLHAVLQELKTADQVFIMGPAGMKKKLQAKLEEDQQLTSKLAGIETTDHLTLEQCVQKVKNFYHL